MSVIFTKANCNLWLVPMWKQIIIARELYILPKESDESVQKILTNHVQVGNIAHSKVMYLNFSANLFMNHIQSCAGK